MCIIIYSQFNQLKNLRNILTYIFFRCSCWDACIRTKFGQRWMFIRTFVLRYVDTPAFEWFVLVLIFASSITLCFEDIHLEKNKPLKKILYWTNLSFCMIFVIEMFFKWIALGFYRYFTSFWTLLDFTIVFVSIENWLIYSFFINKSHLFSKVF